MTPVIPDFIADLYALGVCDETCAWAAEHATLQDAWEACNLGGRMAWLLGRLSGYVDTPARKKLALVLCECFDMCPPLTDADLEVERLRGIDVIRLWARDKQGIEDLIRWVNTNPFNPLDVVTARPGNAVASLATGLLESDRVQMALAANKAITHVVGATARIMSPESREEFIKNWYAAQDYCARLIRAHYPLAPSLTGE